VESYEIPKVFWDWEEVEDWERRVKGYGER